MVGYKLLRIKGTQDEDFDLFDVLTRIGNFLCSYRWSVSDLDVCKNLSISSEVSKILDLSTKDFTWISGEELYELSKSVVCTNWGAFLGFEKTDADFHFHNKPYSEGRPACIQHPSAQIEIQAVDGGYFEVFTRVSKISYLLEKSFDVEIINSEIN